VTLVGNVGGATARNNIYPFPQGLGNRRVVPFPAQQLRFEGNRYKILSYNASKFYGPQKNPKQAQRRGIIEKPAHEVKALADVVNQNDPDVIALQEVESRNVLENFNNNYLKGRYPNIVIYPTNDKFGTHVAYMSKDTVKLVDAKSHRKIMNSDRDRPVFTRDFLEATYQSPTGYEFTLFNTHFMSMRRGEQFSLPIRLDEARAGAFILKDLFHRKPNARVMVLGDLNTLHHTSFGRPVLKAISGKEDQDPTNDLTEVLTKDGIIDPTHWSGGNGPNQKLDYALASAKMLLDVVVAKVVGCFTKAPWNTASDHLPLLIEVEEPDVDTTTGTVIPRAAFVPPPDDPQAALIARLQSSQGRGRFQQAAPTYTNGDQAADLASKLAPKKKSRFQRFA
jgi:endonuclease/exonuclease/phosphatase family metal-dependent hydrolase